MLTRALLREPKAAWRPGAKYGLCGAAPMPVELMRNFQDRTGVKILLPEHNAGLWH